jgi:hypothetical protein
MSNPIKVTPSQIKDTTVWLSQRGALPFDLWHQVVTYIVEKPKPKPKEYIIINDHVLHITPGISAMTPLRMFGQKEMLVNMDRVSFGSKLRDSRVLFDIMDRRMTIEQVLAL